MDPQSIIKWTLIGDASESAMIKFTQEAPLFDDKAYEVAAARAKRKMRLGPESRRPAQLSQRLRSRSMTLPRCEIKFNSKNKHQVLCTSSTATKIACAASHEGSARAHSVPLLARDARGKRIEITDEIRQKYEDLNLEPQRWPPCARLLRAGARPGKYPATWTGYSTEPTNFPIGNDEEEVKAALDSAKILKVEGPTRAESLPTLE